MYMDNNDDLDDLTESEDNDTRNSSSLFSLSNIPLPKAGYMMVGFLLIAAVSGWLNLKQAKTIDAQGDVLSSEAKISALVNQASSERERQNDPDTDPKVKQDIGKNLKTLNDRIDQERRNLINQKQDVKESAANLLNGSWFWTLIIQVGSAAFGIGVINIILSKKENPMVRSAAILVIGVVVVFMLLARLLAALGLSIANG